MRVNKMEGNNAQTAFLYAPDRASPDFSGRPDRSGTRLDETACAIRGPGVRRGNGAGLRAGARSRRGVRYRPARSERCGGGGRIRAKGSINRGGQNTFLA